jgi:hypothetical protein
LKNPKTPPKSTNMRFTNVLLLIFMILAMLFLLWQSFRAGIFGTGETRIISNHNIVLEKIEELGKLELVKYKFRDVLEYNVQYDWWPDSKAVLIISGEAVGCIDLKKIKAQDILDKKDTLFLTLPTPELCYYKLNHNESKVYNTDTYSMDTQKLVEGAYKEAEQQVKRTALQSNILAQTRENGEKMLKPLLENLAKKKIVFTYQPEGDTKIEKK